MILSSQAPRIFVTVENLNTTMARGKAMLSASDRAMRLQRDVAPTEGPNVVAPAGQTPPGAVESCHAPPKDNAILTAA